MISFQDVSKRYASGHEALQHVNFTVSPGEMVFITGHSGAGKSTLLKLIAALEMPTYGQVVINNIPLKHLKKSQIPFYRRHIGMVFQDPLLLHDRTIFDNVALPLVMAGMQKNDIAKRVRAGLDKVGLRAKEQCFPLALSCGEQQRVGIARALVHKPVLLLADEPTGNLDPQLSQEMMTLFRGFNQVGVTVIIATHDVSLISQFPHRLIKLRDGKLQ